MHFCLLQESPLVTADEFQAINDNQMLTAHRGRDPDVRLSCMGESVLLRDKARELLEAMRPVAELLNAVHSEDCYTDCLDSQIQLAWNAGITPQRGCWRKCTPTRKAFLSSPAASHWSTAITSCNARCHQRCILNSSGLLKNPLPNRQPSKVGQAWILTIFCKPI